MNIDKYTETHLAILTRDPEMPWVQQVILLLFAAFTDESGACTPAYVTDADLFEASRHVARDLQIPYAAIREVWEGVRQIPGNEPVEVTTPKVTIQ
jgi:hypothetical protein